MLRTLDRAQRIFRRPDPQVAVCRFEGTLTGVGDEAKQRFYSEDFELHDEWRRGLAERG